MKRTVYISLAVNRRQTAMFNTEFHLMRTGEDRQAIDQIQLMLKVGCVFAKENETIAAEAKPIE